MAGKIGREWLIRSISGGVFVGVIVLAVLWCGWSSALLWSIFSLCTLREFYVLMQPVVGGKPLVRWPALGVGLLLVVAFWWIALDISNAWIGNVVMGCALLGLLLGLPCLELGSAQRQRALQVWLVQVLGIVYVALPFGLIGVLSTLGRYEYDGLLVLFPLLLLWVNDTGAFVFGSLWGRHKLMERVSPSKTWEGVIGGGISSALLGAFLGGYASISNWLGWLILGILISVGGTIGDLIASQLKRTVGVKDSGRFLPGHGGFLDRFDSVLLAMPITVFYLWLLMSLPS